MAKDSGGALRQHYKLATGSGLQGSAPGPQPGFSRGGMAIKSGGSKAPKYAKGGVVKGFTPGIPTRGAKNVGTVNTTSNVKGADPKGFKIHGSKKSRA